MQPRPERIEGREKPAAADNQPIGRQVVELGKLEVDLEFQISVFIDLELHLDLRIEVESVVHSKVEARIEAEPKRRHAILLVHKARRAIARDQKATRRSVLEILDALIHVLPIHGLAGTSLIRRVGTRPS